jgi:hypothetical protein
MIQMIRVRLNLKPGQRGTKKLLREYGKKLVNVRYRYDDEKNKRYTTIELIVDEAPWKPPPRYAPSDIVRIKIGSNEVELREKIKLAGGKWSKTTKTWQLPYKKAVQLGVKSRILKAGNI